MLLYPMAIMANPAPRSLADAPEIPSIVFTTQILVTWNTTTALGLFMNLAGLSSNSPPLAFPTLKSLALRVHCTDTPTFLGYMEMPQLRSISLYTIWARSNLADETERRYTGPLASKCHVLTSVSIHFRSSSYIQGSDPNTKYFSISGQALAETIRPLLTLHGFHTLSSVMEHIDLEHSPSVFLDIVRS